MAFVCTADKSRNPGDKNSDWSTVNSANSSWKLSVVTPAASQGPLEDKGSTTWQLVETGDDEATFCRQAMDSPVIFCEGGLEGDFVLSTKTMRFIRSRLVVGSASRDSVIVGKCIASNGR